MLLARPLSVSPLAVPSLTSSTSANAWQPTNTHNQYLTSTWLPQSISSSQIKSIFQQQIVSPTHIEQSSSRIDYNIQPHRDMLEDYNLINANHHFDPGINDGNTIKPLNDPKIKLYHSIIVRNLIDDSVNSTKELSTISPPTYNITSTIGPSKSLSGFMVVPQNSELSDDDRSSRVYHERKSEPDQNFMQKDYGKMNYKKVKTIYKEYGYIFAVVALTILGIVTFVLFGVVRCLRATRRASRALALPIPLLPEDRTPLNAEPEHPAPMLSVQSPGYAGMERLGVPARTSIGSPSDDRSHLGRLMHVDALQVRNTTNSHHHYHHQMHGNDIRCPHHVPLPDSEWGPDRDIQIRASYQQAEITRTYIKAPPNKTALDVPEHSYNIFPATSACNLNQQASTAKSKNAIAKFFSRISSPKSPESPSRGTSPTTIPSSTSSIHKSGISSDVSTNHSISSTTINIVAPMTSSTLSLGQSQCPEAGSNI